MYLSAVKAPKRVVIVGPVYPYRGGIADFNEELGEAFRAEGAEVNYVSFTLQYPGLLFPGKSQFAPVGTPPGPASDRLINSVWPLSWLKTGRRIAALKPDLVLFRFWLPFFGPALGTIARVVRRRSPHSVLMAVTDNVIPHEKRIGDAALTRYFLKPFQGFVTLSRSVLDDLSVFTSNKCKSFLPHPIYDIFGSPLSKSDARKELGIDPDVPLILFFGFIRAYKGLDILLEAMRDAHLKEINAHLLIAGEFYESEANYEQWLGDPELAKRLIIKREFIPKEEVRHYFSAADIVAQPYKHATQSGVTQIAYQFNCPMLVTNVGGLPEIVPDKKVGYVVEPNAAAVASSLVDYFTQNRQEEMTKAVTLEKARFSWKAMVSGIVSLYNSILTQTCA